MIALINERARMLCLRQQGRTNVNVVEARTAGGSDGGVGEGIGRLHRVVYSHEINHARVRL